MARTNPPHPRSFLAFACCARVRVLRWHQICPAAYPAEVLRQVLPAETAGEVALLEYLTARAERYVAYLTECERSRLADDGWSVKAIGTPQMRETIKRVVAQRCLRELREHELARARSPKLFEIAEHEQDDGWFPRDVVVDVIAGTHFALGRARRRPECHPGAPRLSFRPPPARPRFCPRNSSTV